MLSVFPQAIDTQSQLFQARNNAVTVLMQTVSYVSRVLVVSDTSAFPPTGLLRVGGELLYYDEKTPTQFRKLKRGFAGSRQGQWPTGTPVVNAVMADPHNAVKDALLNLEADLGVETNPAATSLNGILSNLEQRFLAPKPIFQALPRVGVPPLTVQFQNFSGGEPIRYLWDFGDGGRSVDISPTHTYLTEGNYTVKLNMITSLGAHGIAVKTDYIQVSNEFGAKFFYVSPLASPAGSTFQFVDQTQGEVVSRTWIFDDGTKESQDDPDIHYTEHIYDTPGEYTPSLLLVFANQKLVRLLLPDPILVT